MKYLKTFENLFDKLEDLPAFEPEWKFVYAFDGEFVDKERDEEVYEEVKVYGITKYEWADFSKHLGEEEADQLEYMLSGDQMGFVPDDILSDVSQLEAQLLENRIGKFLGYAKVNVGIDGFHSSNFKPTITGHHL